MLGGRPLIESGLYWRGHGIYDELAKLEELCRYFHVSDYDPCKTCNENGTLLGKLCDPDTEICTCRDGWYGYKCLFGKSPKVTIHQNAF